jgi:predicted component of type VI protein secretion system
MIRQPSTCAEPLAGELIVRNGPDRGVSRSLLVPFTLIGSGDACDLRILDETVRLVHCAVSVTPDGPHLRSVGGLTPVNGVPSSSRLLQTGDVVTVGPVDLEVHWRLPPSPLPTSGAAVLRTQLADLPADDPVLWPAPPARRSAYRRVAG